MKIAIVADSYSPMQSSAAIMIKDLAVEFAAQGHKPLVIIPDSGISNSVMVSVENGIKIYRVLCPPIKDLNYFQRTLSEFYMPFAMRRNLKKDNSMPAKFDGIVWYSPSIFHAPLIRSLKKVNNCKSYLILRDIFPKWAADLGIMSRWGPAYWLLKAIERFQYSVADTIGIQTPANFEYFKKYKSLAHCHIEVLNNWLSTSETSVSNFSISNSNLAGRKLFVYAGNMGKAQSIKPFFEVIATLDHTRNDIGFVFVGRGSEVESLNKEIVSRNLSNVIILDEIKHDEIPSLYAQCDFGMVFLDPCHKTHNIPGKFISYMHYGLPVLACINEGNDLLDIINSQGFGLAFVGCDTAIVSSAIEKMVNDSDYEKKIPDRCRVHAAKNFSASAAVEQITASFKK